LATVTGRPHKYPDEGHETIGDAPILSKKRGELAHKATVEEMLDPAMLDAAEQHFGKF
jgi:hypothetical protein